MAEQIIKIISGLWSSKALHAVAALGVADILHKRGGAATAEQIAADIGDTDPRSLYRLLRHVASLGIFDMQLEGALEDVEYHKTYAFRLNDVGQFLRSDHEGSILSSVLLEASDFHYRVWGGFLNAVKTGKNVVKETTGADNFWAYLEGNPQQETIFNAAMTSYTAKEINDLLREYDFSGASSIVDIGGGLGSLLFAILRKYPEIKKGHLFDLASVVKSVVVPEDLKDRVELHGGSFLDDNSGIPSGADVYIMKHIIHDWDDALSEVILKASRKAMPDHGKVILIEYTVPSGPQPCFANAMDLHMMTLLGAKERTKEEYAVLFRKAGLELEKLIGSEGAVNVIVAKVAQ